MRPLSRAIAHVLVAFLVASCASEPPPHGGDLDGSVAPSVPFGGRCGSSLDCLSGVCVEVASELAICTRTCESDADCPAGINWGCVTPSDADSRVCGCTPDAEREVCGDRRDNDCDGDVDDCRICDGIGVPEDDPEHCGACFRACRSDEACADGECVCAAEGALACGGECVDPRTDAENCGACGSACPSGWACAGGECTCPAERSSDCGGECVDLASDPAHCGACENACPAGQTCLDGACGCADGDRDDLCPGIGCVDLESDETSCGACGNACAAGEICSTGVCSCPTDGFARCDGACIDVRSDAANCGACGRECPDGESCVGGACTCPGGLTCGGECVRIDEANCGACGRACRADQRCAANACRCVSGTECGGACVDLASDGDHCGACGNACPGAQACIAGRCQCPVAGTTYCAALGGCVDFQTDATSCGWCGNACPSGQACVAGRCACPAGQTYCATLGRCVDLSNDPTSCGSCGRACFGEQVCSWGSCQCPTSGETYCASAGECVSLWSDPANCGGCGRSCEGPTTCVSGSCRCPTAGETFCASAGACLALTTDEANCGACGRVCAAGATCTSGACQCPPGQTVCSGTCVDTSADPGHCGTCGTVCGALQSCVGGACSCPSPRPLALRRISNDFFASVAPSMASDGARTALVWSQPEYQSHSTWSVWLQLLDRDGAPIGSPVVLASGTALFAASVAWTGSEWAVVWLARQATSPYPNHPIFLRVASDGTPIGTPVDLATSFSPTGLDAISVAIGHAPGSGLAMLVGTASDVRLLLLGSGEGPFGTPTRVGESGAYRVSLVGAPDGRFGALLGSDELQVVNADGSITTSVVPFSTLSDPQLAHDGSTWLVTGVRYEHGGDRLVALRGPSLTSTTTLTTVARYVRQSAIAIAGDGSATVVWSDAISYHGAERLGRLHSVRLRLPASATEAAVVETASSALFPEAMVDYDERHAVVHVGADRFVSAWVDRRWGQAEIYALAAEIPACM